MRVDGGSSSPSKSSSAPAPTAPAKGASSPAPVEKKPAPPPRDSYVEERVMSRARAADRKEVGSLKDSPSAKATDNRDGSVTRSTSRTTARSGATTKKELTTRKGALGDSQLKYQKSRTEGDTTKTTGFSATRDVFGRVTSSRSNGTKTVSGDVTTSKTTTVSKGALGRQTTTVTDSSTTAQGKTEATHSTARSTSGRFTSTVTTDKKETVASTRKVTRPDGSEEELKTGSSSERVRTKGTTASSSNISKLDGGTYQAGFGLDRKKTNGIERSGSKYQEHRADDKGFSQAANGKEDKARKVGDTLGAAGAKHDFLKEDQAKFDHVKESARYKDETTFVGSRVGTRGEQQVSVGADGATASIKREAVAGLYAEKSGKKDGKYGTASFEAKSKLEANASVSADAKLNSNGLTVNAGAKAEVVAEASINGKLSTRPVKVAGVDLTAGVEGTAKVQGKLGAEATGKVQLTRHPPTAVVEGTVGASAVLKAEGNITVHAGPFAVKASGYGSAGAEAQASGVLGYHDGKLEIGGKVGAALGLGLGGSATVEVDVKQIGDMAKNAAKDVADVNHDGKVDWHDAGAAGSKVVSGAKKVASWFGF